MLSCGGAIESAQDFYPNKPPVIDGTPSFTYVNGSFDADALIDHMTFDVTVAAHDPENGTLTYTYTSGYGSFAGQEDTAAGSAVKFVTGSLKAGDPVAVTITVSDKKRGATVYTLPIGTGKKVPSETVTSAAPSHLALNASGTVTVTADCDGFFQVVENNTDSAASIHFNGTSQSFVLANKGVPVALALPSHSSAGNYVEWVLFLDYLNQEAAPVKCAVTVP
jgi:hypothetical protein